MTGAVSAVIADGIDEHILETIMLQCERICLLNIRGQMQNARGTATHTCKDRVSKKLDIDKDGVLLSFQHCRDTESRFRCLPLPTVTSSVSIFYFVDTQECKMLVWNRFDLTC